MDLFLFGKVAKLERNSHFRTENFPRTCTQKTATTTDIIVVLCYVYILDVVIYYIKNREHASFTQKRSTWTGKSAASPPQFLHAAHAFQNLYRTNLEAVRTASFFVKSSSLIVPAFLFFSFFSKRNTYVYYIHHTQGRDRDKMP